MKVAILGEESGIIRDAFLKLGHNAISCDLKPTSSPGPHLQGNMFLYVFGSLKYNLPPTYFIYCKAGHKCLYFMISLLYFM